MSGTALRASRVDPQVSLYYHCYTKSVTKGDAPLKVGSDGRHCEVRGDQKCLAAVCLCLFLFGFPVFFIDFINKKA